jgi:deoxyribose-phosphate aldolase
MPAIAPIKFSLQRLLDEVGPVDQVAIEERVAKFATRSIKKASKLQGLNLAVSMVDLTTLEGNDTPGKVASLCQKAQFPDPELVTPQVAAVCVYPFLVKHARRCLGESSVRIASVATGFPAGQVPLRTRIQEVKQAVKDGADEIDMVIQRGLFLSGKVQAVQDEISAVVEACGNARLKVILEVSELESYDKVRAASFLAMQVLRPGDFIKTSTGKTSGNATLAYNQVMLEAIRDFYLTTGTAVSMKPAGGIKNSKQALHYLVAVKETLGDAWLTPERYRFGASSLLNDLLMQLRKQRTGVYQAPWKFSDASSGY